MRPMPVGAVVTLGLACSDPPCPVGSYRDPANGLCTLVDADGGSGGESGGGSGGGDEGGASGTGGGTGGGGDTGDGGPGSGYTRGDPITVVTSAGEAGGMDVDLIEWVEATVVGSDHVVLSGQGGAQLYSLADGSAVGPLLTVPRTFRSAADGVEVVFGGREAALYPVSFADPSNPERLPPIPEPPGLRFYEDVAYSAGRVLLGAHGDGGILLARTGTHLATLPATDAYGTGLAGDRAVLTDLDELILFDISDPRNPLELDRVPLGGEGRDIDFNGDRIAVALGGRGVEVWDVEADVLVSRGSTMLPGAALDVTIDGDEVWVGAWDASALLRITADGLVVLGLEEPRFSAMAVGARNGRAVVADWYGMQLLERSWDVSGPELDLPDAVRFWEPGGTVGVDIRNWGPDRLRVEFDASDVGHGVSPETVRVDPGGVERVRITAPSTLPTVPVSLPWTSNDPDEPSGVLSLAPADQGVGTVHADFTLQGFVWPDPTLRNFTLSEQRGKVVLLAYFALF